MQTQCFNLPDWNFVGGETQTRVFTFYGPNEQYVMNLQKATCTLSICDFVNQDDNVLISKPIKITSDTNGNACSVSVSLSTNETIDMSGKYLYQLTIVDINKNVAVLRGAIRVSQNIDKSILGGVL